MLIPVSWLSEFVKIPVRANVLAEKLLLSGTKVEKINKVAGKVVLNLEITPNRPDTLSVYGLAREVAAIFNENLKDPDVDLVRPLLTRGKAPTIKVKEKSLCPYFSVVKLGGVFVKDSPSWLKDYLIASGIRPINNVVDITNFVMLELGQPMHAFDATKIKGDLTLRAAVKGEKITTLDSVVREVNEGAIIIEDEEKLIDLAGLMGGENSEVDSQTKEIILHVPVYDPIAIRKTSQFTNLRTEASNRFEKKLDPNLHPLALKRAVKLLVEYANVTQISQINSSGYPVKKRMVDFNFKLVKEILGIEMKVADVINLLSPLGFLISTSPLEENNLSVTVPSHRTDISIQEDILEEIGRLYGYNNFPKSLPSGEIPLQKEVFNTDNENSLRNILLRFGFNEVTGFTLVSEKELVDFGFNPEKTLKVLHPTSKDFEYLRPTLLINLVRAVSLNRSNKPLAFFEIAKEFYNRIDQKTKLPEQNLTLAFISNSSYRQVKGVVEYILSLFKLKTTELPLSEKIWQSGVSIHSNALLIAKVGYLSSKILDNYNLNEKIPAAWVNLEYLLSLKPILAYSPLEKFPPVIEDISFFISENVLINEIIQLVTTTDKLVKKVEFLDSFLKDSKKSLTLRIYYQNPQKTLTDEEVARLRKKISNLLVVKFKAQIR